MKLSLKPLTPDRWSDWQAVFDARGCSMARGCACMYYRWSGTPPPPPAGTTRAQDARRAFKALVDTGAFTGLIGYHRGEPIGWVSVAPREQYAKLQRSPVMKPVDDAQVWSVVCFVVPAAWRGQGVASALLAGTVAYARRRGWTLEAYPVDAPGPRRDDELWFGTGAMFERAGFEEVARRKPARPVVRLRAA